MPGEGDLSQKTDVVKLFIVLMALSTMGFGIGAAYLYHQQSACARAVEKENRAWRDIIIMVEDPKNKPFWGSEPRGAHLTSGVELPRYLTKKARTLGLPPADKSAQRTTIHPRGGYSETKVTRTFLGVTLEQIVRYLYNVQDKKTDVFIKGLTLRKFNYNEPITTCSAEIEVVVHEEVKKQPEKK